MKIPVPVCIKETTAPNVIIFYSGLVLENEVKAAFKTHGKTKSPGVGGTPIELFQEIASESI